ncbi:MAG: carbamate kinase [Chlorobi bacterium]|nr:carbamate kinase [Chlorobiota bacterium]
MSGTYVVALGGNALMPPGGGSSAEDMARAVRRALEAVFDFVPSDARLIITHGNGPQVGNLLLKDDAGASRYGTPSYPLDMLVAQTQGEIGYLIERELRNLLARRGIRREAATLVTMIGVDASDPGFADPQKRVGPMYDAGEARRLSQEKGWRMAAEQKGGRSGYRRVVASPEPKELVNKAALKALVDSGFIVTAVGGGGIPVVRKNGRWEPVEAVIDKDLASALVAAEADADALIILTDVPRVYRNYGKPGQIPLDRLSPEEAERLGREGEFGKGNMWPKVRAAVRFARATGRTARITDFEGLKSGGGTVIG